MKRKSGFSLVELLIVLAVMAALIATITPVALNAIKKAKATQVGQNLKTLSSSFENALYVNGTVPTFTQLGRDIEGSDYAIYYTSSNGSYDAVIVSKAEADVATVKTVLSTATKTAFSALALDTYTTLKSGDWTVADADEVISYSIEFEVY